MTRSTFFKHFELLADQPDAVAKLRTLIFELAAEGMLLGPASKPVEKTHLGEFAEFVMGQAPAGNECNTNGEGTIFVKAGEFGPLYAEVKCWTTRPLKFAKRGDVLICVVGATVGKLNLAIDSAIGRSVAAIRPSKALRTKFLYYSLMPFVLRLRNSSRGSAQGVIGKDDLGKIRIWIPTTEVQDKVVAKVDGLMSLCDELEQRQQARQHARGQLQQSALHHLQAAREPSTFAGAWQRVRDHFHLLHDTPDALPQLRQAILSLAVQGHLVQRIQKDGTGGEILNGIGAKPITPADAPFLPDHWKWAALGDLVVKMDSGWSPACPPEPAADNQWGVLKTTAVQSVRYLEEHNKVLPRHLKPRPEHEVMKGDILITRAGPKNRVGVSCVVESTRPRLMISDKIVRFQLRPVIFPRFAALCLNAGYSSEVLERLKSGMAESQMNISQPKLKTTPLPVPPLAEQKRIVARVEELLRWCDTLEAQLHQTRTLGAHLLASTLHHLLAA
jgi:type I restriction enzyme S subunit